MSFKETTERLEKVAFESFKSTIKNLKIQKKQLKKQIEEKRAKLVKLEKQTIDENILKMFNTQYFEIRI